MKTLRAQVLRTDEITSNSIIFFDAERVHAEQIQKIKLPSKDITNVRCVPVKHGGIDQPLIALLTEEDLNHAGYVRK